MPDPRQTRRQQLLDVALGLFAERGYHSTTIADIIAEANVARGTFYNYFDSKRQIFGTLLDQLFDAVTSAIFPIRGEVPAELYSQVRGNIAGLCQHIQDNMPMARVLLEKAVGLDAEGNAQLREFYNKALKRMTTALRDGQALGIIRDGDPNVMATCLLGMIKESFYQQMLGTQTIATEDLVEELFRFTAQGILRTSG